MPEDYHCWGPIWAHLTVKVVLVAGVGTEHHREDEHDEGHPLRATRHIVLKLVDDLSWR